MTTTATTTTTQDSTEIVLDEVHKLARQVEAYEKRLHSSTQRVQLMISRVEAFEEQMHTLTSSIRSSEKRGLRLEQRMEELSSRSQKLEKLQEGLKGKMEEQNGKAEELHSMIQSLRTELNVMPKCPPQNDRSQARCGPSNGDTRCNDPSKPYCNEIDGLCGALALHRDAQLSDMYDYRPRKSCMLDLPSCPLSAPSTMPENARCGPSYGNIRCTSASEPYCNDENGYCGASDAHRDAQPGDMYDFSPIESCAVQVVKVTIGSSVDCNEKCVTLSEAVQCDPDAGKEEKRASTTCPYCDYGLDFHITVSGTQVCAKRQDADSGWRMQLAIWCEKACPGMCRAPLCRDGSQGLPLINGSCYHYCRYFNTLGGRICGAGNDFLSGDTIDCRGCDPKAATVVPRCGSAADNGLIPHDNWRRTPPKKTWEGKQKTWADKQDKSQDCCFEDRLANEPESVGVPRLLHLTGKQASLYNLSQPIRENVERNIQLNPGFKVKYWSDAACRRYLQKHFDSEFVRLFDRAMRPPYDGAYRGDICRTAVLHREGGFYIDLDLQLRAPLLNILGNRASFLGVADNNMLIAARPCSCILKETLGQIPIWYDDAEAHKDVGILGPATLKAALVNSCPGFVPDGLDMTCGSEVVRLYRELPISCERASAECPVDRHENYKQGIKRALQFAIFSPGLSRDLVAWSRFATCPGLGCGGGLLDKAQTGSKDRTAELGRAPTARRPALATQSLPSMSRVSKPVSDKRVWDV